MQGKGLIRFFIAALIFVCLYQLMFTFATYRVEKRAENIAEERILGDVDSPADLFEGSEAEKASFIDSVNGVITSAKRRYLDSISSETVLDIFVADFTYQEIKERQLNLGLDLQGGMSVVLQVSLEELVKAMSNYSKDPTFLKAIELAKEKQKVAQEDFVTLFGQAFRELDPGAKLAAIFATPENKDKISFNSTNEQVLAVIKEEANAAVSRTFNIMRSRIDEFGVTQPNITLQESSGRIIVELPGVDNPERARKLLQSTAKLEFWETFNNADVFNFFVSSNDILRDILGLIDTVKEGDATDSLLLDEETSLTEDLLADNNEDIDIDLGLEDDTSDLDLFGEGDTAATDEVLGQDEDPSKLYPLFSNGSILIPATMQNENGEVVLREGPVVGYAYGQDRAKVMEYLSYEKVRAQFPKNIKFLWSAKPFSNNLYELFAIKTRPNEERAPLEGDVIIDARQDYDQTGKPDIDMVMNNEGARTWRRLTKDNIGKSVAIVLDDVVYSAPVVQSEISGGRSQITGNFEISDAKDLASIIKSGKLPAPARIIEEEIVGPSLGKESINAGLMSLAIGLALVLLFMVLYYSGAGIIADIALLLNLFFIMGVLASFGASLTLPGMAGIVLTIGMAVDANVIIFERIREELLKGKGLRLAIVDGYSASYSAIVDANITTLITAFILLFFGLGPVKGFATVLVIGIFSSFITAVLFSRLIVDRLLASDKTIGFTTKLTEGAFKNMGFQFVDKRKIAYVFSTTLIVIGLASIVIRGFELGVDFKGGRSYVVRFDQAVSTVDITNSLNDEFGAYPVVKSYGGASQVKITTAYLIESNEVQADSIVEAKLYAGLKPFYNTPPSEDVFSSEYKLSSVKVGPTIADDIKQGAVWAAMFSFIGIFLYILVRFRKWQFGLGALAAVVHDVLVLLGIFSLFGGILPFSTEIDQAFIAALLTIIGYSINDTVVVFDRVREYMALHQTKDLKTVVNMAINGTLSRTIMTSFTTLIVVIILTIFGGEVIRGFSFALLIGILVGTYSSIFVATPIVVDLLKGNRGK